MLLIGLPSESATAFRRKKPGNRVQVFIKPDKAPPEQLLFLCPSRVPCRFTCDP